MNQTIEAYLIWMKIEKSSSESKKKEMLKESIKILKDNNYKETSKVLNLKAEVYLIWKMTEKKL